MYSLAEEVCEKVEWEDFKDARRNLQEEMSSPRSLCMLHELTCKFEEVLSIVQGGLGEGEIDFYLDLSNRARKRYVGLL